MESSTSSTLSTLEQYRNQRDHVLSLVTSNPNADDSLLDVLDSLNEMVALLEDSEGSDSQSQLCHPATSESDQQNQEYDSGISSSDEELQNTLLHMQCRAPFEHSWGPIEYGNAMIQSIESTPATGDVDDVYVRVLFLQPTHRKMMPCQYHLDGKCRFTPDKCRFSHGEVYPLSKLKPYSPPNFHDITEGSQCLSKNEDGLWSRGTVSELMRNEQDEVTSVIVKLNNPQRTQSFDVTDIVPVEPYDESVEEEGSSDECVDNVDDLSDDQESSFKPHQAWDNPVQPVSREFGGWEAHTKGVGSKLMAKMGFIIGQGLGVRGGRTEPVSAEVLPKGRSLDYCMELREAGGRNQIKKVGDSRRQRAVASGRKPQSSTPRGEKTNVFDVINMQLRKTDGGTTSTEKTTSGKPKSGGSSQKDLNIEAYKLHDRMSTLEKELGALRRSFARNSKTDKAAAAILESKIAAKQSELSNCLKRQTVNEKARTEQRNKKSLEIF